MAEEWKYNEAETPGGSDTECKGCPQGDACRKVWSTARRGRLTPTGLSLSSSLVFLLPIATAITAGAIAKELTGHTSHSTWLQILAACIGLGLGAFAAWLLMRVIKRKKGFYGRRIETNHRRD